MANGMLRLQLRRENGTTQGAARSRRFGARTYGRYAMRFKADPVPGFKVAWLLWPQSGSGTDDGEIDFPEGNLHRRICAFMHFAPASRGTQDAFCTTSIFASGWHTAVFEWARQGPVLAGRQAHRHLHHAGAEHADELDPPVESSLTEDPPRGGRRREHLRRLGRRLDARLSGVTRAGARPPGAAPA